MVTRSSKSFAAKQTIVEDVTQDESQSAFGTMFQFFVGRDWKAPLLSFLVGFCVAYCVGYLGGLLLSIMVIGTLAVTGSMFLAWVVYILGLMLVIAGGVMAASFVQHGLLEGGYAQRVVDVTGNVAGRIGSLFSRKEVRHA